MILEAKPLKTPEEYAQVLEHSQREPVLLFKHSTLCPVSAQAQKELRHFLAGDEPPVAHYTLVVQTARELSKAIAEELGVKHETPQVLLLKDGAALAHLSHYHIREESLWELLEAADETPA